jgi:hypothetical protein
MRAAGPPARSARRGGTGSRGGAWREGYGREIFEVWWYRSAAVRHEKQRCETSREWAQARSIVHVMIDLCRSFIDLCRRFIVDVLVN